MQEDRVYDNLLNLPLFLGMSRNDLLEVAGHTKFDFQKAEKGLTIVKEGRSKKFIQQVEQITFNGHDAAVRGQNVLFVTERAVLKLCEEGLELIEVAPGIDLQRDVLDQMDFQPIVRNVKLMDAGIFSATWGGLAALHG